MRKEVIIQRIEMLQQAAKQAEANYNAIVGRMAEQQDMLAMIESEEKEAANNPKEEEPEAA